MLTKSLRQQGSASLLVETLPGQANRKVALLVLGQLPGLLPGTLRRLAHSVARSPSCHLWRRSKVKAAAACDHPAEGHTAPVGEASAGAPRHAHRCTQRPQHMPEEPKHSERGPGHASAWEYCCIGSRTKKGGRHHPGPEVPRPAQAQQRLEQWDDMSGGCHSA